MWLDDHPYEMSEDEIHEPRDVDLGFDDHLYDEDMEEITCPRCGRIGPRYEIEGHSCSEPAA